MLRLVCGLCASIYLVTCTSFPGGIEPLGLNEYHVYLHRNSLTTFSQSRTRTVFEIFKNQSLWSTYYQCDEICGVTKILSEIPGLCGYLLSDAIVTCEISKLFHPSSTSVWNNFISARENLPEIISKLFHSLIAAHEHFQHVRCRWNNFEIILQLPQPLK